MDAQRGATIPDTRVQRRQAKKEKKKKKKERKKREEKGRKHGIQIEKRPIQTVAAGHVLRVVLWVLDEGIVVRAETAAVPHSRRLHHPAHGVVGGVRAYCVEGVFPGREKRLNG